MNKEQFLIELAAALAGLPEEDIEKSLEYYSEMIDDRTEDGISEEEAVAALGTIAEIRAQIIKDTPLPKIIKEKVKPKRSFRGWEIAMIIIGFPLWFPLLIAAAAVVFSVYVTLWSVIFRSSFGGRSRFSARLYHGQRRCRTFADRRGTSLRRLRHSLALPLHRYNKGYSLAYQGLYQITFDPERR